MQACTNRGKRLLKWPNGDKYEPGTVLLPSTLCTPHLQLQRVEERMNVTLTFAVIQVAQ